MTMTATELLQALDWWPDLCEIEEPECLGVPATHTITMLPCECNYMACSACADIYAGEGRYQLAKLGATPCGNCKKLVTELRVEPLS